MIGGLFSICLSLGFWILVIRFIAKKVVNRDSDRQISEARQSAEDLRQQLAERDARDAHAAAAAAARRADAALLAVLPPPGVPRTVSESVDLQAVETAAYSLIMQAHEEGWIDCGDFADRAATVARRSERDAVPAVAIAAQAAELRRRGGFGREA